MEHIQRSYLRALLKGVAIGETSPESAADTILIHINEKYDIKKDTAAPIKTKELCIHEPDLEGMTQFGYHLCKKCGELV
jgi:hypothetical protein